MGYGSYRSTDWDNLRSSRNINSQSTVRDLYRSKSMKDSLNPYGVAYREFRDSMDNPASTAIIIGLDVTGSMGYLSEEIAKGALNRTMMEIYDKNPVTNPHIMFQAIGDSLCDSAPLQTTQFEADILQQTTQKLTAMKTDMKRDFYLQSETSAATKYCPKRK